MKKVRASVLSPSLRRLIRGLRFCGAAFAFHGLLLCLSSAIQSIFPGGFYDIDSQLFGMITFWILAVPALLLTAPFNSILWKYGLMNAPGWFAWPKALGITLAYTVWVAVFLGLAQALRWWYVKNNPA